MSNFPSNLQPVFSKDKGMLKNDVKKASSKSISNLISIIRENKKIVEKLHLRNYENFYK